MAKLKRVNVTTMMDDEDPEFQIAPMIDVLLVLLIFFMSITTTDVMQKNKEIVLPEASQAAKASKEGDTGTAIVNVQWLRTQAIVKLDDTLMPGMGYLSSELQARREAFQRAKPKGKFRVIVRGDVVAHFSSIRDVMDACASAGINNVTFSVIQKGAYTQGGTAPQP